MPSTPSITGCERDVARERIAALIVQFAHGRADLVVGIGGDILHQEIHQARIALQDAENLQGAVGGRRTGGRRGGLEAGAALAVFAGCAAAPRRARPSSLRAASESFP